MEMIGGSISPSHLGGHLIGTFERESAEGARVDLPSGGFTVDMYAEPHVSTVSELQAMTTSFFTVLPRSCECISV